MKADTLLQAIPKLDKHGKGAEWEELVQYFMRSGVPEAEVVEAINHAMDAGLVYEPILGRLRKV